MENYYKILGINPTASPQQINYAYKSLLTLYQLNAEEYGSGLYVDLTAAYNTLINKDKKEEYDRILNSILTPEEYRLLQKKQQEKEVYNDYSGTGKKRPSISALKIIKNRHLRYGAVAGLVLALLLTNIYIQVRTNQKKEAVSSQQIAENKLPSLLEQSPAPVQKNIRNEALVQNTVSGKHLTVAQKQNAPDAPSAKTLPAVYHVKTHAENPERMAVVPQHNPANEKDRVLATLGTPHSIVRYGNNTEIWHYTHNVIHFQNGRVVNGSPEQNTELQLN